MLFRIPDFVPFRPVRHVSMLETKYYEDGTPEMTYGTLNGVLNGMWKEWYCNGNIFLEGWYVDGKMAGLWRMWHANGNLQSEGAQMNNQEEGLWREWHENGQLAAETFYQAGVVDGWVRKWDDSGKLIQECMYKRGSRVETEVPDSTKRHTDRNCLIYKDVPESGQKYLLCSFSEDHVMNYNFMKEFTKFSRLSAIRCVYCDHQVQQQLFEQTD